MTSSEVNLQKMKVDVNLGAPLQGVTSSEFSVDGWDGIALEYSVDWPLQLFFTPDVFSKYAFKSGICLVDMMLHGRRLCSFRITNLKVIYFIQN